MKVLGEGHQYIIVNLAKNNISNIYVYIYIVYIYIYRYVEGVLVPETLSIFWGSSSRNIIKYILGRYAKKNIFTIHWT